MRILHLTLKKEWFDLIESGEKTEEYRVLKNYWFTRLYKRWMSNPATGIKYDDEITYSAISQNSDIILSCTAPLVFNVIVFKNGYKKNAPKMVFKCKEITIDYGKESWGAEKGIKYFVIKLGKRIS